MSCDWVLKLKKINKPILYQIIKFLKQGIIDGRMSHLLFHDSLNVSYIMDQTLKLLNPI